MKRLLLLGIVFLLEVCGSEENPLADSEWRLVALGDAAAPAEVVDGEATGAIDGHDEVDRNQGTI